MFKGGRNKNISNAIAIAIINQFTKCHNRLFKNKKYAGLLT